MNLKWTGLLLWMGKVRWLILFSHFRTGRNLAPLSLMHLVPMLPPPQSVTMSSWLSFPAKRWVSIVSVTILHCYSLLRSGPHNAWKHPLTAVLICNLLGLACDWVLSFLLQDLNAQDQDEDPMNKLKGQKIVSCRICKGDHWTTRCPYKDTLGPMQKELAEQLGLSTADKEKPAGSGTVSTPMRSSDFD